MAKVTVLGRGLSPAEIEALQGLLAETGACQEPAEILETIGDVPPAEDDAIVVVLGTPATCLDAAELEADLVRSQASAQRVVWVWPEGSTESELPAAAKKYCYSVVSWNAQKLAQVMADGDFTCVELADGTPRDKVETERNICVVVDKVKPT